MSERNIRVLLVCIALGGLAAGTLLWMKGASREAGILWAIGAVPVVAALAVSIIRDIAAGRLGVDAVALVSMTAALALGENLAAAVVAVMYAGGTVLEVYAITRAERDLKHLINRAPRIAHRRTATNLDDILVDAVEPGDRLLVRAGEIIPVDGTVMSAIATIDEQALTGEPIPVERKRGAHVASGTVNAGEAFDLRATGRASDSTYAGIVRMVAAAHTRKAPFLRLADRYAVILLPATLLLAALAWVFSGDSTRALAVLVAATPCPLILAAPVAFIAGVSRAARHGILVKGGGALEALASIETVVFDKTGTLTVGGANLIHVATAPGIPGDNILRLAASLEQSSQHVVAAAVVAAALDRGLELEAAHDVIEVRGAGLEGSIGGIRVRAGSEDYVCVDNGAKLDPWAAAAVEMADSEMGLTVFIACDGRLSAVLVLADRLRPEAPAAIDRLRRSGIRRFLMLTGDHQRAAERMAANLDLDEIMAGQHPEGKVAAVTREKSAAPTLMIGDGINDAPALAAATVGMAMSARGASASSEAADAVILVDRIDRAADAIAIAQRARAIALQSVVAGMALSGLAMLLAAFGWLTPVAGALSQEAIDVAVILNALRALSGPAGEIRGGGPA